MHGEEREQNQQLECLQRGELADVALLITQILCIEANPVQDTAHRERHCCHYF